MGTSHSCDVRVEGKRSVLVARECLPNPRTVKSVNLYRRNRASNLNSSSVRLNPAKAQRKHTSSAPNLLRLSEALRLQRYRDAPLESSRAISDKTEIEVCR